MKNKHTCFWGLFIISFFVAFAHPKAQTLPASNIHSILLSPTGNPNAYPIITLGAQNVLQLDFDDFDRRPQSYYYSFVLCNEDWQPVLMSPFDYIKGFQQSRIREYHYSSIAKTHYIHYHQLLPQNTSMPTRSGNYLLKVFLNGDTAQLAFEKRVLIVDSKVSIAAEVQQPRDFSKSTTFQKIQFSVDVSRLKIQNPRQQLKVVVLQNYRWDNAILHLQPLYMQGNVYKYNGGRDVLFPAGKEYRWIDVQSFRFQSERIKNIDPSQRPFVVNVLPDKARVSTAYLPYVDYNGFYKIASSEQRNPWWQGDYAKVNFSFLTEDGGVLPGKDVYIIGQMNDNTFTDKNKLKYNVATGMYEISLLLKQGYYSYIYATKEAGNTASSSKISDTEGNFWQTENDYTILVYYQSFADRAPQLVGYTTLNSQKNR